MTISGMIRSWEMDWEDMGEMADIFPRLYEEQYDKRTSRSLDDFISLISFSIHHSVIREFNP